MSFTLPKLPYQYNSLEPYFDSETMEIHHTKHHQTYIANLNAALDKYPELYKKTIEELLKDISSLPSDIKLAIQNNGGGHSNHSFFWEILTPNSSRQPEGEIAKAITDTFGSLAKLQEEFKKAAVSRFGSGWAWLVLTQSKELKVISTSNQDSPYMEDQIPLLGLDVWEHSYYLKYRNLRVNYIDAFWHIINWNKVESIYQGTK